MTLNATRHQCSRWNSCVTGQKFGKAMKAIVDRNSERCASCARRESEGLTGGDPFLDIVKSATSTEAKQFFSFKDVQRLHRWYLSPCSFEQQWASGRSQCFRAEIIPFLEDSLT